jgi:trimeric autotransporter adhesin
MINSNFLRLKTAALVLLFISGGLFFSPSTLVAQTVFGLSSNTLVKFDAATPGTVTSVGAITGISGNVELVCLDFRPATGQLYALAYNNTSGMAQLYTINTTTAEATAIGTAPIMLTPGMGTVAMDFNPVVDRIRVVGGNNANFRLHPVTGALVATDGSLAFAATDINSAVDPAVGACAYTNSYIGTTATTLINFDEGLNLFCTQIPPNNGVLNTIGVSGLVIDPLNPVTDFDITFDAVTKKNVGLFVANLATGGGGSSLCTVNLTNGICIPVGLVGAAGTLIQDIAVLVPAPSTAAIDGQLAYALTNVGTMISFDTEAPALVRSQVTLSGLAADQVIVGMDFRPATGDLVGLGYNATTMECSLYTINLGNGVCTPIGTTPFMLNLGTGAQVGFDFNPTVDRIRVVAANNVNVRLNPITGGLAATDTNLAFASTDVNANANASVGAAAYTNSFNGATTTQLFVTDDSLNVLCLQMPPNNGTLNTIGSLGIMGNLADLSTDLDIYYDHNTNTNIAYGVANVAGSVQDALYNFNTTSGAFSLKGSVGLGIAVRDLAIFIDSISNPVSVFEPLILDGSFVASPNPAVEKTTFQFDLKTPGQVQIIVTDMIGRHTTVVMDKDLPTGPNAVEWMISGRNAGYYFAQLWVNGHLTGTQKLIIR